MSVSPLVAFAGLVTIGLLAMRLPRVPWHRAPGGDVVLAAGGPLVLLGVVLGPGIDFVNRSVLDAMAPVTTICLGWVGAGLGARFERRYVRSIPRAAWRSALVPAGAAFIVVGVAAWAFTRIVPALAAAWTPRLPAILTLAAVSAVAGPGAVTLVARTGGVRPRASRAFGIAATLQAATGVIAITVPLALARASMPVGHAAVGWLWWVVLAVASGVLAGMIFLVVARSLPSKTGVGLALLAALAFGAGVGYAAGLSPLLVCAVATALIVNRSPHRGAVRRLLAAWERLIYVVLLVAIGALLVLPTAWLMVVAVSLAALRAAALWAAVRYGRATLRLSDTPLNAGLGTVAQGGVAVGLGASFLLSYGAHGWTAGDPVLTTVVLGVGASHLVALPLIKRAGAAVEPQRVPGASLTPVTPTAAAPELHVHAPADWAQ